MTCKCGKISFEIKDNHLCISENLQNGTVGGIERDMSEEAKFLYSNQSIQPIEVKGREVSAQQKAILVLLLAKAREKACREDEFPESTQYDYWVKFSDLEQIIKEICGNA